MRIFQMTKARSNAPNPAIIIPIIESPACSSAGKANPPPNIRTPAPIKSTGKTIEATTVTCLATLLIIHKMT